MTNIAFVYMCVFGMLIFAAKHWANIIYTD